MYLILENHIFILHHYITHIHEQPVWMDKPNYGLQPNQLQLHQQMQDLHQTVSVMQQQQQPQAIGQQPLVPYQLPPTLEQLHNGANMQANLQGTQMDMAGVGSGRIAANNEVASMLVSKTSPSTSTLIVTPPSVGVTLNNGSNSSVDGEETTAMGTLHTHTPVHDAHTPVHAAQTPVHTAHNPINAVAHASLARLEVNLEELEMEAREQDAQASGAVLALAMGVCITALLVVLVGCRLRGVRRRLRRHRGTRSPYAHDADYLVNGMYL
ncbi:hypothetical protein OTU49_003838 [Cherax quadricarinatus]|uniref:Uncharacterized protein n=1 Tax=Cherax quadricarinatus TaxID=27406 RepID=A0AAW0X3C4_CHEQU